MSLSNLANRGPSRRAVLFASLGGGAAAVGAPANAEAIAAVTNDPAIRRFRASVPQEDIDDLRRRVRATRWAGRETVPDQSQGVQLATMRDLARYWATGYDWRRGEAKLNRYPQFLTTIDGVEIHFIQVRSRHPGALPLIISHGWPGSVIEQLKVIEPLTDPTAHGGKPSDAFDVIIPSLPGFGFSGQPTQAGWGPERIGRAWATLMQRIGYTSYVAQGGDWGSPISSAMARQAPPGLRGIHINLPAIVPTDVAAALACGGPAPVGLTLEERATFDALSTAAKTGARSYAIMMGARPQTIGYGVTDSPVGLAAWMLGHPGFSRWTAGADSSLSRDEVLDDVSLYWFSNSAASAARIYWEYGGGHSPALAGPEMTSAIALPVAITVFPGESYRAPESWARKAYRNLIYFRQAERGGHFAAWQEPELFSSELRAAFRPLRQVA